MSKKPQRIAVAINPRASFGRGADVGDVVVQTLRGAGYEVTTLVEPDGESLWESTRAVIGKHDALVVVGGDGMAHLGANVVAGTRIPLGIVPTGTGNDLARGLGIAISNAEAAMNQLLESLEREPRVIDAGRIRGDGADRWFACIFSAGFDAIVNERANQMRWPKGRQRYNLALLRELAALTPIHYRIELDDETIETRAMLVAVANNTSFGGGMLVTPDALLDDGLFDVLIVQPLSRIAFLRIFPRVFKGTHVSDPRVRIVRSRRVTVHADTVVAYADGERIAPLPLELEIVSGALRVFAPEQRAD
ncbi:MAG: YegS/Rv2252/BmrU family lipid kinase [Cryobacterium sp.]|nr:YegS/Rv2252/BmrU family lipid kinase [Cryobacterium sp.]